MSFWSEASPVTKGVIVVGPIVALILILMVTGVIGGGAETTQVRGVQPQSAQ